MIKPIAKVIARRVQPADLTVVSVRVPAEPFQLRMLANNAVSGCIAYAGPGTDPDGFSERCFLDARSRRWFDEFVFDVVAALERAGFVVELDSELAGGAR